MWYKLLKNPQLTLIHFIMASIKLLTLSRSFPSRCNSNTAYHSKNLFLFHISICLAPNRNMKYKISSEPCKACELHYPVWENCDPCLANRNKKSSQERARKANQRERLQCACLNSPNYNTQFSIWDPGRKVLLDVCVRCDCLPRRR